jgi:hypothetical protein
MQTQSQSGFVASWLIKLHTTPHHSTWWIRWEWHEWEERSLGPGQLR